jgi:hypothetical protein
MNQCVFRHSALEICHFISRVDDLARLRPERLAVLGAIAVEPATAEWFFAPERARRCCRNEAQAAQRS